MPESPDGSQIQSALNHPSLAELHRPAPVSFLQLESSVLSSLPAASMEPGAMPTGMNVMPTGMNVMPHHMSSAQASQGVPTSAFPAPVGMVNMAPGSGMGGGMPGIASGMGGAVPGIASGMGGGGGMFDVGVNRAMLNPSMQIKAGEEQFVENKWMRGGQQQQLGDGPAGGRRMVMKFDPDATGDEARMGAYSPFAGGQVTPGCSSDNGSMWGVQGYKTRDVCSPPSVSSTDETMMPAMDFQLIGGDKTFNGTIWSWSGYFNKRPFFVLRSALNPHPLLGIGTYKGDSAFFWSEGLNIRLKAPTWYITRQLGNKHKSQIFARWRARGDRRTLPANWPAQDTLELSRQDWVMRRRLKRKHLSNYGEEEGDYHYVNIITKRMRLLRNCVVVGNGPENLNGRYCLVGEYLAYPFYRQDRSISGSAGFVMYRGRVVASDKETWVISALLGNIGGLLAYAEDPRARIPTHIKVNWLAWQNGMWMPSNLRVNVAMLES